METNLTKINNSFYIIIPEALIEDYKLSGKIELYPTENGILINTKKKARVGWAEQLAKAIAHGQTPDDELL